MVRSVLAVIIAVITWFIVATIVNWILRVLLPGYSAVEATMNFTLAMMVCRLVLGLVSSLCAGFVCAAIARNRVAPKVAAGIMVILFLPVHYMLWSKFPIWYHLFFLITLAPTMLIGARRARR
jgi:fructose-specific phosphotransferase system IIC component